MKIKRRKTIPFLFGEKHRAYIRACQHNMYNVAEGAIRAGKTIDNIYAFAKALRTTKDRIHLATGATVANAKLNLGDANGFGLEWIFRGQCKWGKYKDNEALIIKGPDTLNKIKIVIFAGGGKADSFKKIRGNSYGMWIATEINLHHETFIKEAFNRTAAADVRRFFWDLNPDHPKAPIYSEYIDKYAELHAEGKLLGGYNYQHFTLDDNATLSQARREEIKSQYDPTSIWYMRDIEGQRVVAEGLVYGMFAEAVRNRENSFALSAPPGDLMLIILGVDFGASTSAHSFTATGITRGYREVVSLATQRIPCKDQEIDPTVLGLMFVDFVKKIIHKYGIIHHCYADSAEQVLMAGLRTTLRQHGLGWLKVENALKEAINERINLMNRLIAQGRYFYIENECQSLVSALSTAIWDPKELTKNVRLDDGSSDIDSLDSHEYTIERYAAALMRI